MAGKKSYNENYRHECKNEVIRVPEADMSCLFDGFFSAEELSAIFDFYLVHTPVKKSKDAKGDSERWLGDYGWAGSSALSKLEGELLKCSGISSFCILKSGSINLTVEAMQLNEKICPSCPRAVFRINCKPKLREDGSLDSSPSETRLGCVFRHIRNCIAHGQVYGLDNRMLYLRDKDEDGTISAAAVIGQQTLLDWIKVVDRDATFYPDVCKG